MKLAPVPMAFALHPEAAIGFAGDSARTSHGALEAVDARYFAALIVGALRGATVSELLHQGVFDPGNGTWDDLPLHPKVLTIASGSFHAKEPPAIRGGGRRQRSLDSWPARCTAWTPSRPSGVKRIVMGDKILGSADALYDLAQTVDRRPPSPSGPSATPQAEAKPTATPGDSYWVLPGKLLAGPYPGAPSKSAARSKLETFVDLGVTRFVDLTEEGEGPPLHPYATLLRRVAKARSRRITYLRMPIRDVDIPTFWRMRAILATLRAALITATSGCARRANSGRCTLTASPPTTPNSLRSRSALPQSWSDGQPKPRFHTTAGPNLTRNTAARHD